MLAGIPGLTRTPGGRPADRIVAVKTTSYRETIAAYFTPHEENTLVSQLGIDNATVEDLLERSQEDGLLPPVLPGVEQFVLVDTGEVQSFFDGRRYHWDDFYARYPDAQGVLHVSAVGMNPGRTEALVFYGDSKGLRHGLTQFVVLRCNGKSWRVDRTLTTVMF